MHHREAVPPAGLKDAGGFIDRAFHVVHVLKGHESYDEVERRVVEREVGSIGELRLQVGVGLLRRG